MERTDFNSSASEGLQPGPVCGVCPFFHTCVATCDVVEALLPSMERGRVDFEDLPRLHMGIRLTQAILDHEGVLTDRQREIVQLYYRESLRQEEIALRLEISQQAVHDSLDKARQRVGKHIRDLARSASPLSLGSNDEASSTLASGRSASAARSTTHRR